VGTRYGGSIGAAAGSTFKAFTAAAAIEQGLDPTERIVSPQRAEFKDFENCDTGAKFPPFFLNNSTGSGTFNMFQGTAFSVNTYFMALEKKTGICRPAEIAEELGLSSGDGSPLRRVPTFTLGTTEVTPLGMASAYGTFGNNGVRCPPIVITRVTDRDGKDLSVPRTECEQVLPRSVAQSVTVLLKGVIDGPLPGRTGQRMSLGRDAAGKTGTINDSAAVWFVGYTPDLAAAVATYDPRGNKFGMKNITIGGRYYDQVFGSTLPGPIWKMAMLTALEGTPATKFDLRAAADFAAKAVPPKPTFAPTPTVSASPDASPTAGGTPSPAPSGTPAPTPTATPTPTPKPSSTKKP
jgi:membrane peptidoglycan carboxypeptidase